MPDWDSAYIPPEKLTHYLLSESHLVGKSKAEFFRSHGFVKTNSDRLASELLGLARKSRVRKEIAAAHGTKFIIEGSISTPGGKTIRIVSIWIVEPVDPRPRFVTAYPA